MPIRRNVPILCPFVAAVAGVLAVTTVVDSRSVTETIRYNPNTGVLLDEGKQRYK